MLNGKSNTLEVFRLLERLLGQGKVLQDEMCEIINLCLGRIVESVKLTHLLKNEAMLEIAKTTSHIDLRSMLAETLSKEFVCFNDFLI